jgi:UDP-glucose 4-epimerase
MGKRKISLVTGGAGFIGSHVADYLLKMGHKTVVLDDLSGGFRENLDKKHVFIKGSITDEKLLDRVFREYKFNYVYHLAAYAAEGLSHFIRRFNYENNLTGSINLINRAVKHKVEHFVFTSSIAVYGANQVPMSESATPMPKDPYGIAKYAVELDLKAAKEMFGLDYTVFRPHNVYGERQNHGDPYRNVLGIFVNNIMKGEPMPIFGDGRQTRAFTYIADVAPYIAKAVVVKKAKNEVFNIGADKAYSVLELAGYIAGAMGVKRDIKFLPARNEVTHAFSDHKKFVSVFNAAKKTDLDKGIKRMVEWAKEIGPKSSGKFKNIELNENMPPSWRKLTEG